MCIVRLTGIHREVSSLPITGDQIDWIRETRAPQNRTHNTQLVNNARHKNHEVVYARKFKIINFSKFHEILSLEIFYVYGIWYCMLDSCV